MVKVELSDRIEWYKDGNVHRDVNDGPAVVLFSPRVDKYIEGGVQLFDLIYVSEFDSKLYIRKYIYNGKINVYLTCAKGRFSNDCKVDRYLEPAIEKGDGTKEWWVDGKLHRENEPAIERADGTKEWWVDGKQKKYTTTYGSTVYLKDDGTVEKTDGYLIDEDGDKRWYNADGSSRRENAEGDKAWFNADGSGRLEKKWR